MLLQVDASKLKQLREQSNITAYRLAKDAGLSLAAIYRLENGTTQNSNFLRVREIARVLGCKVEDICTLPERSA